MMEGKGFSRGRENDQRHLHRLVKQTHLLSLVKEPLSSLRKGHLSLVLVFNRLDLYLSSSHYRCESLLSQFNSN
ncbi:hypothetical protein Scep_022344 [Stephania cephalantha]|uniref:Uncharacterized protein n=1 Tax=Stephania cephalantha TaxID=152367 RepID=A0AAP0F7S5_9MAGN